MLKSILHKAEYMKIKNLLCAAAAVSAFVFPSIANAETEKGYTLTPVENETKTSITLYKYDKETGKLIKTYNELNLAKTTYGSGENSTTVDVSLPNNKTQTITVNYNDSNAILTPPRIPDNAENGINLNYINNGMISDGGAIYNSNQNTIGDITGNFINNYITTTVEAHGGAIANVSSSKIGNITGDFIKNLVDAEGLATGRGGAIYNESKSIIGNVTSNFINNSININSGGNSYGGAIYNGGFIASRTGDFIANNIYIEEKEDSSQNAYGGAIYNSSNLYNITVDLIGN